ncbi:MAG: hypothetical protein M3Z96_13485 [Pseudomonadota bacterium]|nr:hypothetical protein [Pseudomonadota bacterium]
MAAPYTPSGGVPPLVLPAGALGIWSVVRAAGWNGACLNVRRASDNVTRDIYWKNNIVDWETADVFANGTQLFVTKWYDQSGNGKDLAQATTAKQPKFNRNSQWNGIRPVTCDTETNHVVSATSP